MNVIRETTKKVTDSLDVKHQLCDIYRNNHGVTKNAWIMECDGVFSVQTHCEGIKHYERKLNEYLNKHDLSLAN